MPLGHPRVDDWEVTGFMSLEVGEEIKIGNVDSGDFKIYLVKPWK